MEFLLEFWPIMISVISAIVIITVETIRFFGSGTDKQLDKVREWLVYATAIAEKELGSGTGKLKLRYVYDMFVTKFPWIAKFISFARFSVIVDEALDHMESILATNDAVNNYVTGTTNNTNVNS